jgi:hypothetical protein
VYKDMSVQSKLGCKDRIGLIQSINKNPRLILVTKSGAARGLVPLVVFG